MDDKKVEEMLYETGKRIPIDNEFKRKLRKTFEQPKTKKWHFRSKTFVGLVAAALLFLSILFVNNQPNSVNADELLVTNALSFIDIASGDIKAIAHQHDELYVSIKGEGIFAYQKDGLNKIINTEADGMSVNPQNTKMLFSNDGSIYILDLKSKKQNLLVRGTKDFNNTNPIWEDNDSFYLARQTEDQTQIILVSLSNLDETFVTNSSSPSIGVSKEFIVYEKDKQIMKLDLKKGTENVVDQGVSPSVAKDGTYISYIKEENGYQDLWITDSNLDTRKKITHNLQQRYAEQPLYQYSSPIWGTGNSIYLIKNQLFDTAIQTTRLMKVELGTQALTAKETVERFMQALIVRDDDYARSLMQDPPEFLTGSNPSITGYSIVSSSKLENKDLIEVEITLSDNHLPYSGIVNVQFELKQNNGVCVIERISELKKVELSSPDMENLQFMSGDTKKSLVALDELKARNENTNKNIRFSSTTVDLQNKVVLFALQEMPLKQEQVGFTLWSYNLETQSFKYLDRLDTMDSYRDISLDEMTLSPNKQLVAMDISLASSTPSIYVYDLKNKKNSILIENARSVFWQGEKLIYENINGSHTTLHDLDFSKKD